MRGRSMKRSKQLLRLRKLKCSRYKKTSLHRPPALPQPLIRMLK